jgi:monoamine oxidase
MHDVIVIGGGFAGAAALSRLAGEGRRLLLLEARGRLGGRAFTRAFGGTGHLLEFGGSWITPWQERIRAHAARHGIALRPRARIARRLWFDGRNLRTDGPADAGEQANYEAVMARIAADAKRLEQGLSNDLDGHHMAASTLNAYLARLGAGRAARAQAMAWWSISGNGDPDRVSAGELLSSCAYGEGRLEGMLDKLAHTLDPGASVLVERMVAASGAEVATDAAVTRIARCEASIEVAAADGRAWQAANVLVAVPLNTVGAIAFDPPLALPKAKAAERGHDGRAIKLWLEVAGVEVGTLATGGESGPNWLFAERKGGKGETFCVAFAVDDGRFDPTSRREVETSLARLLPDTRLMAWDWVDWIGDPCSRGTWVALPADFTAMADTVRWGDEGHLSFAGSDIAAEAPGWFEAAISSGEAAAERILARLRERHAAASI